MQKAAFFDIDKTLYSGTLAVDFARQLRLNGIVAEALEENGLGEDADVVSVLKALQKSGKMPYKLYLEIVEKTAQLVKGRFNGLVLSLFKELREDGFCMVALSQAPFLVLKQYCNDIDGDSFDVVASAMPTTIRNNKGDVFLGPSSVISSEERDKGEWVKKLVDCYGFDLSLSLAIGDSFNDIAMLEAVGGRKIAYNPDEKLMEKAKSEDWEILMSKDKQDE